MRASTCVCINACTIECFIHLYRFGFQQLIDGKCADILQPDITWMGGITEVRRREGGREGGREKENEIGTERKREVRRNEDGE